MGDVFVPPTGSPANRPFAAGQVFDAQSVYGRMRASMRPEAKMRGFLHYLAVQAKHPSAETPLCPPGLSRQPHVIPLVLAAGDPAQDLPAHVRTEWATGEGGKRQFVLSFQLRGGTKGAAAPCRAFLITPGVLQRLCGPDAVPGADAARKALLRLFNGQGTGDPFETARILAAVPELDGDMDETGCGEFRTVELPDQAHLVDALPEQTTVVIVIDGAK
jgi:hypothetical protein